MHPSDHYRKAEEYLAAAELIVADEPGHGRKLELGIDLVAEMTQIASVHALLSTSSGGSATPCPPCPPVGLLRKYVWSIGLPTLIMNYVPRHTETPSAESTGEVTMKGIDAMAQIQDNQQVVLSVAAQDAAGNPVTDSGSRTWAVGDSSLATLTDNGDGTQTLAAVGPLGTVTVTVTDTEASPDGGTTPGASFQGSLAVDIVSGPVTEISVTAGTPTDKAAAAAPVDTTAPADGTGTPPTA